MQRKFLEELGLEKEIVDKIMAENGSDIEKAKSKLEAERDNYKSQLETAQAALKEFEGIDVKELNGKIATLTADLETRENEYQARIADMEFNSVLDGAITKSGARNAKALKALLDIDMLKASKNQTDDINAAIEKVKAENDYLFETETPLPHIVSKGGGLPNGKMTLTQAMKYANEHPDIDVKTLL